MPKTLLLADDSVTIQKVVGITFANEDVELVTVDNGDDALVRARQIKPDLVLADIGMPGLNGYELCGAIRRDPQLTHVPVLLLTGTFETYDEERAREAGASGHIAKPFEAQALVDRVFALLAQAAAPKPAAPPPAPAPRPAAAASAPNAPARPAAPSAPAPAARPAAPQPPRAPAPPIAPAAGQSAPPRPRPELPPMPGASGSRPTPRPAATAAPAPTPTPRPAAPFEFELPAAPPASPAARTAPPAAPAPEPIPATPVGEAVWEAEPELEAIDETPVRREAPEGTPDATRLFAPDLLGRATRLPEPELPEVPEPPAAPQDARRDFSFGDLDFEEPTGAPPNPGVSQIFGDSFGSANEATVLAVAAPLEPVETEGLADPLYSQTRFLDPQAAAPPAHFDTPNPAAAPPLPDLLGGEEITQPADADDEPELAEADLEPLDADEDLLRQPFSPETEAALSAPEFEPLEAPRSRTAREQAATRLILGGDSTELPTAPAAPAPSLELPDDLPPAKPLPLPERDTAPSLAPRPARSPAPTPSPAASTAVLPAPRVAPAVAPMIDSAQLAQVVEKVAWEAFGALSEQVVGEVMKRVEAVVWEVVPQLCERLIQEEIARLKADLPE